MMGLPIDIISSPISSVVMVKMVKKVISMCAGPISDTNLPRSRDTPLTNQWRASNQPVPPWAPLLFTLCYLQSTREQEPTPAL